MYISYASSSTIPSRFANSINVMKMCHSFAKLGHRVVLMAPDIKGEEREVTDAFSWYGVGRNFAIRKLGASTYPSFTGRIIYALNYARGGLRPAPDLVYGRDWPAVFMAASLGYSTVLELHEPGPSRGLKRLLFDQLVSRTNVLRIVVNSEALRDNVADGFPQTKKRLLLARNGADRIPSCAGRSLPISRSDERMIVGYAGHLYPGRGMEILGEFAQLCAWADFHIVGGWPNDVAMWQKRLASHPNVKFHGNVPPRQVPDFLHAVDVLIAPYQPVVTLFEGEGDNSSWVCPIKVFEYMSAGKPIICSDLPVLREVLRDGEDALICAATDARRWAEALRKLRDNRKLGEKIAASALAKFNKHYSWDTRAATVLEGLEVTGRRGSGSGSEDRASLI